MIKEGDLVKIVGKFDGWPWGNMVWNLGDLAYVAEIQGSTFAFLKPDLHTNKTFNGIFKIETDLIKIESGSQLPLPSYFKESE